MCLVGSFIFSAGQSHLAPRPLYFATTTKAHPPPELLYSSQYAFCPAFSKSLKPLDGPYLSWGDGSDLTFRGSSIKLEHKGLSSDIFSCVKGLRMTIAGGGAHANARGTGESAIDRSLIQATDTSTARESKFSHRLIRATIICRNLSYFFIHWLLPRIGV